MNEFLSKKLYLLLQSVRREPVAQVLAELERTQYLGAAELRQLQAEYLARILGWASKTCKAYQKYQGAPLADWPLLTKSRLSTDRNSYLSDNYAGPAVDWSTSGSTGNPVVVRRSFNSIAYHHASLFRAHRWYGIDVGQREARLWGVPHTTSGRLRERLKDFTMNRIRASAYELNEECLEKFWIRVVSWKPAYLFGYSSLLDKFAEYVISKGRRGEDLKLKAVVCTSETLMESYRENIQRAFSCPVVSEYGSTETGIIAYECPNGGMHIPCEAVNVELLPSDIEGLQSVVLTDLHNAAMPLIRYQIGDLAACDDSLCKCGRFLPKLKNITGRESSIIETPDGRKIHTILFYYSLCDLNGGGIKEFQVVRTKDFEYVFNLVPGPGFRLEKLEFVKKVLAKKLGSEVNVICRVVTSIPRTAAGKFRDFVDQRKPDTSI